MTLSSLLSPLSSLLHVFPSSTCQAARLDFITRLVKIIQMSFRGDMRDGGI